VVTKKHNKHPKVRRQRQVCHHQPALALVRADDAVLYLEDLRVANVAQIALSGQ